MQRLASAYINDDISSVMNMAESLILIHITRIFTHLENTACVNAVICSSQLTIVCGSFFGDHCSLQLLTRGSICFYIVNHLLC